MPVYRVQFVKEFVITLDAPDLAAAEAAVAGAVSSGDLDGREYEAGEWFGAVIGSGGRPDHVLADGKIEAL